MSRWSRCLKVLLTYEITDLKILLNYDLSRSPNDLKFFLNRKRIASRKLIATKKPIKVEILSNNRGLREVTRVRDFQAKN